jgi:hypothetical protein
MEILEIQNKRTFGFIEEKNAFHVIFASYNLRTNFFGI